jgi:hypothetical protein
MKHIHFLTLEDFAGVCFREVQARELQLLESQVCFIVFKSQCRSHLRWRVAGMFCPCFFFCFFVRVASYGGSARQPELSKLLLVRSSPLGLELGFNILPHAIALYIGYS